MSSTEQAIARIRAGRERWVEIEPGKTVLLRRPAESEFPSFFRSTGDGKTADLVAGIEDVQKHVVNWRGFTEADIFGAADGSSDAMQFSQALWAEIVSDNADWSHLIAKELVQQIVTHIKGKGDAAKKLKAHLEASAGIQYEGEEVESLKPAGSLAIQAWNHLHNGQGAIDWAGLPLVAELLGIEDLELTLHLFLVIKSHKPEAEAETES